MTGHVKWFDNRKGFGFLRTEGCDEDIFIHYSNIVEEGFKCLHDGEMVEFELCEGDKGFHALRVRKVGQAQAHATSARAGELVTELR